jgi:hypothetical protein
VFSMAMTAWAAMRRSALPVGIAENRQQLAA